jgi:hypothetical protein
MSSNSQRQMRITRADGPASARRGPIARGEYQRRARTALTADFALLGESPLCGLRGVVALARGAFAQRIFPEAAPLSTLLDRAYELALEEVDGLEDKRMKQIATYLRLARQRLPVADITPQLGLHSRSYAHETIQRQALDLITEAFLFSARSVEQDPEVR